MSTQSTRRWNWTQWALVLLVAVSFALRLHDLESKSLWSDEGLTLRRAEQPPGLIFKNLNLIPVGPDYRGGDDGGGAGDESEEAPVYVPTPDLHPPLYFLGVHFWIRVAGRSEFALRFPSAVAATLLLPLLYSLGRALLSREAGLWAALLATLSPFYLWYAQEARMYTWVAVLGLASVWALLPLLRHAPRRRDYLIYLALTAALLYTHYSGFLLLAFEVLLFAAFRLRSRPRALLILLGLLAVALLPLVPYVWRTFQLRGLFGFTYRPLHLILAEAWSSFSLGLGEPVVRPLWETAPFLILFLVGLSMPDVRRRGRARAVLLGYLVLPVVLQYGLSFFRPNYMNPRHLMIASPAWELLLAQSLVTLRRRAWPALVALLGLVLLLRGQANYDVFTAHGMWKDDIRGAAGYIEARARPGDAIVLHHPVIRLTFDYYYDAPHPEIAIPAYGNVADTEQALAEFRAWSERYDRIWFLYGPPPTHFPHDVLPDWADAHLFKVHQQGFEAQWTYVAVAAYDDAPPALDALPASAEPRDLVYGPLRLVGFGAPEAAAGENAWLTFYWRAEGDPPEEPLTLAVRLRDQAGTAWLERTEAVLPFYPPARWPADRPVQTELRLPLPADTPPVAFSVEVEPIGLGGPQAVGRIDVIRPAVREPAPSPRARFAGGIELLAGDLAADTFRAGYPLVGSLTWRVAAAAAAPTADHRLRVRLVDRWGREVAAAETSPSAAGFPTGAWLPDDRVAGRLALPLPADLEGGRYRVQVGLTDGTGVPVPVRHWYGERDWLTLGSVRVEAWPLVTRLPADIDHPLEDVELAGTVRLRGYDLARGDSTGALETDGGDRVALTLYWQAQEPPPGNYHVFVHVGAPDAPPIAQTDGVPVDWLRPTTSWRAGEVIVDTHTLALADVPPGRYNLLVGFYDPQTGQRPQTVVGGQVVPGGYVLLQEIEVD